MFKKKTEMNKQSYKKSITNSYRKKKLKPRMSGAVYMVPEKINECSWIWPLLEVKQSIQTNHPCNGVFTKHILRKKTMIPVIGIKLLQTDHDIRMFYRYSKNIADTTFPPGTFTHGWDVTDYSINGNPKLFTHEKVGSFGLAIAMMVNEPTNDQPNCIFKQNHLITIKTIQPGEELTVYYGSDYDSHRNYSINENKMEVGNITIPEYYTTNKNTKKYQKLIDTCFNIHGGWNSVIYKDLGYNSDDDDLESGDNKFLDDDESESEDDNFSEHKDYSGLMKKDYTKYSRNRD